MVTAAWLITISFIIDNYLVGISSSKTVAKNISSYLGEQENDFDNIAADTALIGKFAQNKYDDQDLRKLTEKKYFLFVGILLQFDLI